MIVVEFNKFETTPTLELGWISLALDFVNEISLCGVATSHASRDSIFQLCSFFLVEFESVVDDVIVKPRFAPLDDFVPCESIEIVCRNHKIFVEELAIDVVLSANIMSVTHHLGRRL